MATLDVRSVVDGLVSSVADDVVPPPAPVAPAPAALLLRGGSSGSGNSSNFPNEKLYVRVGQPVEGCELEPFATLVLRGQQVGGSGAALSFRWSRTVAPAFPCAYSRCKQNDAVLAGDSGGASSRVPSSSSLAAAVRARTATAAAALQPLQCLTCLKEGAPGEVQSVFCCSRCLVNGWREHAQYHARQAAGLASAAAAAGTPRPGVVPASVGDKDAVMFKAPLALAAGDMTVKGGASNAAAGAAIASQHGPGRPAAGGAGAAKGSAATAMATAVVVGAGVPTIASNAASGGAGAIPEEWGVVSSDRIFLPSALDVGHRMRLEVTASAAPDRLVTQFAETPPVLPRPPPSSRRHFVFAPDFSPPASLNALEKDAWMQGARRFGVRDAVGGAALRVCCWNILAEIYASAAQYPYVPLWQLAWSYRGGVVLRELLSADCDILALQEVQSDTFDSQLRPALEAAGFGAMYKTKTREHGMGASGKVDGCALFYRKSRMRLISYAVLELNEAASLHHADALKKLDAQLSSRPPQISQAEHDVRRGVLDAAHKRLTHDNVAQVAVFAVTHDPRGAPLETELPLLVVNTHLFWDPAYADVKLWQAAVLLREIEQAQATAQAAMGGGGRGGSSSSSQAPIPLLLCGDFNSEPSSAVYKLLAGNAAAGRPRAELAPSDLPPDPCGVLSATSRGRLTHGLLLASLHALVTSGREPSFTNLTRDYVGTLDYVWATAETVKPLSSLEIPSADALTGGKRHKGARRADLGMAMGGGGTGQQPIATAVPGGGKSLAGELLFATPM